MNKSYILLAHIIIISVCTSIPATQTTFVKLLQSAHNDRVVLSQDQEYAISGRSYSGIPGIDDIELRIRNSAFNPDNFRYSIRVNPRGLFETRAASRYNSSIITNKDMKRMLLLNTAVYNRYLLFVDLLEQETMHALYLELVTLYDDRISVMENSSFGEDFRLEKLVKAEHDRTKEKIYTYEIEKYISVLKQRARIFLNDSSFSGFDTTGLVSIETIMKRIETTDFELDTNNVYMDVYRSRLGLAEARFNLEKAESRRYIDLLSFTYDNGDMVDEIDRKYRSKDYDLNKAYALEVGVRIPNLTTSRHELNKRKADLLSEVEKYEQVRETLSEKVRKDLADLEQLIAQYRYLKARETEVDAEASLKKFLQIDGIDPMILLEIKENIIKNKINRTKIKYGILRNYLYVIDNAGMLSDSPMRNYLAENEDVIAW